MLGQKIGSMIYFSMIINLKKYYEFSEVKLPYDTLSVGPSVDRLFGW